MFYVVQENVFREVAFEDLIIALERLGLEYAIVKAPPIVDQILTMKNEPYKAPRKDVFGFGAIKMAQLAKEENWQPGMLMTPNHDFEVYKHYYRENLLNWDSIVHKISEDFKWTEEIYFIRPTEDSKVFNGNVFTEAEWTRFKADLLKNGYTGSLTPKSMVQYAIPTKIYKEIRFFIVGRKVVTGSQYRLGPTTMTYSDIIDDEAVRFCEKMINVFELAPAFVMDVCLTSEGWKIVECGCINCAGFYKANMQKLVFALEEYFNPLIEQEKT